jgi:ATP-binding protein involved in chromosome partitioning
MQVAAADAVRGLKTFEKLDVPIIGIIENMSGEFFGAGAGEQLSQAYNVPYLGSIPLEANVRIGGDSGQPIVVSHPDSEAARAIREIARGVAARVSVLTLQVQADNIIPINMIG